MMSMLGPARAAGPSAQQIGRAFAAHIAEPGAPAVVSAMAPLGQAGRSFEPAVDLLLPVAALAAPTERPVVVVPGFAGTKSSGSRSRERFLLNPLRTTLPMPAQASI